MESSRSTYDVSVQRCLTRPNWRVDIIHMLSHLMGAGLPGHVWRYITGFGAVMIHRSGIS